jgi:hypothetical protein
VADKLRLLSQSIVSLANDLSTKINELVEEQNQVKARLNYNLNLPWTITVSPPGARHNAQVPAQPPTTFTAARSDPVRPGGAGRPLAAGLGDQPQPPGPYRIPRGITTVVDLVNLWEYGDGTIPPDKRA